MLMWVASFPRPELADMSWVQFEVAAEESCCHPIDSVEQDSPVAGAHTEHFRAEVCQRRL